MRGLRGPDRPGAGRGRIRHSVDLENKTVTVEETAGVAPEILFDLGFTPVER